MLSVRSAGWRRRHPGGWLSGGWLATDEYIKAEVEAEVEAKVEAKVETEVELAKEAMEVGRRQIGVGPRQYRRAVQEAMEGKGREEGEGRRSP